MPTSAIGIQSVTNGTSGGSQDGVHATVVLNGTPSGSVSFVASRTPNYASAASVPSSFVSGQTYQLTFNAPALWYIWAIDNNGPIAQPGAVWVGISNDPDETLAGQQLQSILNQNLPGLNAALATTLTGCTVKEVAYGTATVIRDFPSILVTMPKKGFNWKGFPSLAEHTFQFTIIFSLMHEDRASLLAATSNLAFRAMSILNQQAYETITLSSGRSLNFCHCANGEADDMQIDDNHWAGYATLVWSGNYVITDQYQ